MLYILNKVSTLGSPAPKLVFYLYGLWGSSCWWRLRLVAAPVFLSLQLRDMESLKVESVSWWFLTEKQKGGMEEEHLSPHCSLSVSFSFDWEFPHTLACATRCWFTPTAGASRGDQDPPRMSNKNSTLSLSSRVKTRGEEHEFNRNGEWNNTNVSLLWIFPSLSNMTPISGGISAEMMCNVCLQNKIKAQLLCRPMGKINVGKLSW